MLDVVVEKRSAARWVLDGRVRAQLKVVMWALRLVMMGYFV